MEHFKLCNTVLAVLLVSSPAVLAQERVAGTVTITGRETGVMYDLPTGLAAELCGVDASRLTQTTAMLTGAFANSRFLLCDVPQAAIDQNRLSPVALANQGRTTATPATVSATENVASEGAGATSSETATTGGTTEDVQQMVRISVAGSIVEIPLDQAAEACDMGIDEIRGNLAALEAGAGNPVSPTETGTGTEAGGTAQIGPSAAAEEVDPDATTTNDTTAMAAESSVGTADAGAAAVPAAGEPLPTAVAVCEISRDRAEELDLPAPD